MYLKVFITCICFLGGTFALSQKLDGELKTCLSTVVEKLCPDCITLHLVIPTRPSWQAEALADHFTDSSPTYALTIFTMDRPGYEDPLVDQVGLYLVNSAADLKMSLKHLRREKSNRNYVVWVNLGFQGISLGDYLETVIPRNWNRGNALGLIFVALMDDGVEVYGTPIQKSAESYDLEILRKLNVCDTKALIHVPQPIEKVIESQEFTLKVIIQPCLLPFVERKTDNPGGFIEHVINILKEDLNFTPKYDWSCNVNDLPMLKKMDDPYIYFNLMAVPKYLPPSSCTILMLEAFWVIATKNPFEDRNILAIPFENNITWHLLIPVVYAGVMVYLTRDLDKTRIMLRLFGMFVGTGVGWLPRKGMVRFMVLLWCFTTYVLVQAYLATLTSELSYPKTSGQFRDTDDLMESKIDVFCMTSIKELYCSSQSKSSKYICDKCVTVGDDWLSKMYEDQLRTNKTWRPFAVHSNRLVAESYFTGKPFNMMPVRIGMWPGIVHSNAGSLFMEKVTKISQRILESGITTNWLSRYYVNNITEYEYEPEMLNTSRLKDMFVILYVGWSCSIVAFLIELYLKWQSSDPAP